jgi:LysW-gamma-L-lysine carboxypeptidase
MNDSTSIDLLKSLVSIASISRQESEACLWLRNYLDSRGISAEIDAAGNVVASMGNLTTARHHLMLLGHIDTVPGFIPVEIKGGKLFGRGSVDAKGSLCTFLSAAARASIPDDCCLTIVGAVEEEVSSSKGARSIAREFYPDACIIGEPSGWDGVTLGYKGRLSVDLSFRKPLSHSAGKESSLFDDYHLWWSGILAEIDLQNKQTDSLFKQTLPTVLKIDHRNNGLEEELMVSTSFRLPPEFDSCRFISKLQSAPNLVYCSETGFEPAWRGSRNSLPARVFARAFSKRGIRPGWKLKTGTSDMNVVGRSWSCPMVAYGPGDSSLDHTPDEHIDLQEYLHSIDILTDVIEDSFQLKMDIQ